MQQAGRRMQAPLCVRTDTFISKTKKLYLDTRTQRNIAKLSEDLSEVHQIMTRNIAEVLGQGERLDRARLSSLNHHWEPFLLPSLKCLSRWLQACRRCRPR